MSNNLSPSWPPEDDALLRELWSQNLSSRAIGAIMKRSKNSVVGRAHRLGLTPRPSPILPRAQTPEQLAAPKKPPAPPTPAPPKLPLKVWIPVKPGPVGACCWPLGHPGTVGFHFCGEPSVQGRSYCDAHCRIAYLGYHRVSPDQGGFIHARYYL